MSDYLFTDDVLKKMIVRTGLYTAEEIENVDPRNIALIQIRAAAYADRGSDFGSAFYKALDDYIVAKNKMLEIYHRTGKMPEYVDIE